MSSLHIVLGHELRCVVDVGSVDSIEIITVRREVYVDEAPVKMWIRALDKKGSVLRRAVCLVVTAVDGCSVAIFGENLFVAIFAPAPFFAGTPSSACPSVFFCVTILFPGCVHT